MAGRRKKRGVAKARSGRRRARARSTNPLVPLIAADARALKAYRSVLSVQAKKRAKARGESIEGRQGKATLYPLGQRVEDTLAGRAIDIVRGFGRRKHRSAGPSRTGKTWVPRNELLNLQVALQRGIRLSPAAARSIQKKVALRKTREWWNIVDSTDATKFEGGETFAATYAPPQTCPADCGMRGAAPGSKNCDEPDARLCYAGEHNTLEQWKALHKGYTGLPWRSFLRKLRNTPAKIVRVNIAGDLPADMSDPSRRHLDARRVFELALAASRHGRNAFTYTHYDPEYRDNAQIIRRAIKAGLQVNLSADNLRDADRKADLGFDVAVVLPRIAYHEKDPRSGLPTGRQLLVAQGHGLSTPAGRKIFFCPSITTTTARKEAKQRAVRLTKRLGRSLNTAEKAAVEARASGIGKTCGTCTPSGPECGKVKRQRIIGFLAHGSAGGAKNLDIARASELFLAPKLTPVARAEVELAIRKARETRERESFKKARVTGGRFVVLGNGRRGRLRRRSA